MMRPRLLRNFGRQITQVFAKDWHADTASELDRLLQILSGAEDPRLASHVEEPGESVATTDEEQPSTAAEADDTSEYPDLELARLDRTPEAEDTSISKVQLECSPNPDPSVMKDPEPIDLLRFSVPT
ncbi:hypothetical protein C5Y97_24425 [Blastopirellula marina]|uniref:Uncharacterized protein n=1 Tax=Blastopirellula marina TaxID=124 RepID=A0A2S8F9S1_9BACT|nr:hypothetical protein C5Y98_24410 [Blastopirellula marina]PTL42180.1 hypothetical protein C5Y97_24425 [Blastopirellula marina]